VGVKRNNVLLKSTLVDLVMFLFVLICFYGCSVGSDKSDINSISVSNEACSGTYEGAEFRYGSDVAHQFSNTMCETVGDRLKDLYSNRVYSKVDFSKIEMTTKGMGTNRVVFKLVIPFVRIENKCDAMTSFDHSGGWNHLPELESRKRDLESVLMTGDELDVSELKTTPDGLQEYWIQWRNKEVQSDCVKSN